MHVECKIVAFALVLGTVQFFQRGLAVGAAADRLEGHWAVHVEWLHAHSLHEHTFEVWLLCAWQQVIAYSVCYITSTHSTVVFIVVQVGF